MKGNIGQARLAGLVAGNNLVGNQYQVYAATYRAGLTRPALSQSSSSSMSSGRVRLACERRADGAVPAIALLRKVGPHRMIAVTMVLWALVMIVGRAASGRR